MKIFLDTANLDEIRKGADWGIVDGVTTNPSLIAKEGRPIEEQVKAICDIIDGDISAEVVAVEAAAMIEEGKKLILVAFESLEPPVVAIKAEVVEPEFQFAPYLHGLFKFLVVPGVVEFQFKFLRIGILFGHGLEVFDLLFEPLDLRYGPLHGDLEGFHRTFQALEEVDLHHSDEEVFAIGL